MDEEKYYKINDEVRQKIWDRLSCCETSVQNMKSIVQNPVLINEDDIDNWCEMKRSLCQELGGICVYLKINLKEFENE